LFLITLPLESKVDFDGLDYILGVDLNKLITSELIMFVLLTTENEKDFLDEVLSHLEYELAHNRLEEQIDCIIRSNHLLKLMLAMKYDEYVSNIKLHVGSTNIKFLKYLNNNCILAELL
jgi:hypothetical protein